MHVRRTVRAEAAPASSAKSANFLAEIISFSDVQSAVNGADSTATGYLWARVKHRRERYLI